jgi:hypothetical protein
LWRSAPACDLAREHQEVRQQAEAVGRRIGRPVAHPADKIEYARLLKDQGSSLGEIATKTGIPKPPCTATSQPRSGRDLERRQLRASGLAPQRGEISCRLPQIEGRFGSPVASCAG